MLDDLAKKTCWNVIFPLSPIVPAVHFKRRSQVEPEVATDRSPEPRTTTEEPLPGYSSENNDDIPGYAVDDFPGYDDEELSGYATDLPPPLPFPTFELTTEG